MKGGGPRPSPRICLSLRSFVGPGSSDTLKAASDPPPASHTGHQYKITKVKNYIQPQKLVCKQIYVLMLRLEAAVWGGTASSAVEAAHWAAIPCTRAEQYDSSHYLHYLHYLLSTIYHLISNIYHLLFTMTEHRQLKSIVLLVLWF